MIVNLSFFDFQAFRTAKYFAKHAAFQKEREQFYVNHPEYRPAGKTSKRKEKKERPNKRSRPKRPIPPRTPFDFYAESRINAEESEVSQAKHNETKRNKIK